MPSISFSITSYVNLQLGAPTRGGLFTTGSEMVNKWINQVNKCHLISSLLRILNSVTDYITDITNLSRHFSRAEQVANWFKSDLFCQRVILIPVGLGNIKFNIHRSSLNSFEQISHSV